MLLISYATSIRWDFIEWKNRHQCKEISTENDRMRWNKLENFIPEKNYENVILIKPYAQIIQKKLIAANTKILLRDKNLLLTKICSILRSYWQQL